MPDAEPKKQTKPQMKRIDGPPKPPTKVTLDLDELAGPMIRVIDSLQLDEQALRNVPEFSLGPGLFVTIDAKQRLDAEGKPAFLVEPSSTVRIHRPDGSVIDRMVTGVEIWGQLVGLFFSKTEQHEIPISSEIELPA